MGFMNEGGTNHPGLGPDRIPGWTRFPLGGQDRKDRLETEENTHPGPLILITGCPAVTELFPDDAMTAGPLKNQPILFRVHLPVRQGNAPERFPGPEILLCRAAGGRAAETVCFPSWCRIGCSIPHRFLPVRR